MLRPPSVPNTPPKKIDNALTITPTGTLIPPCMVNGNTKRVRHTTLITAVNKFFCDNY